MLEGFGISAEEIRKAVQATVLTDLILERERQDDMFGIGNHTLPEWLAILVEEVGELAAAILHVRFGNDDHTELNWRHECLQVAAVAVRMLEQATDEDID